MLQLTEGASTGARPSDSWVVGSSCSDSEENGEAEEVWGGL